MEKTDENFWLVVGQGLYMLMQKEAVLAPPLKGDMHLLESYVLFFKCFWRVEWVL